MKKTLLLTIVFTLWATMAFAQAGIISIFADPAGADCNLVDTTPGLINWYVVHMTTPSAAAVQFQAVVPACYTGGGGSWLSDQKPFGATIGDSQTGVSVAYGSCLPAPIHVLTVSVFGASGSTCCAYPITGHPASPSGSIVVTICPGFVDIPNVPSQNGMINSNATCTCAVAVQETTWGQIKSLYRSAD